MGKALTNHGIIAADWQLQAAAEDRLRAILLPLEPQPTAVNGVWWWYPEMTALPVLCKGDHWEKIYRRIPYQIGDTLFFREKWDYGVNDLAVGLNVSRQYFLYSQNRLSAEHPDTSWQWDWHSAASMPIEAAQQTFLIVDVKIMLFRDLCPTLKFFSKKLGWLTPESSPKQIKKDWEDAWNTQFPNHPYKGNLFVTILSLEPKTC